MFAIRVLAAAVAVLCGLATGARAADVEFPILVPLTGVLSIEGTSQRNGALLAVEHAPAGLTIDAPVADTGQSPEIAVNAFEQAVGAGPVTAIGATMFGPQILALVPLGAERKVPLVTVSGTAKVTELGSAYVFRFFPADPVATLAHARYAVQALGKKRVALIVQTTAYGLSGRPLLEKYVEQLGGAIVFDEAIDVTVKDMLPLLGKARQANPDVLVLHLHAPSTALLIKQAVAMKLGVPIVAGSAMHQPVTAALLEPAELEGVCAESASSPVSGGSPALDAFDADYRKAFGIEPDGYALAQYDGTMMVLDAVAKGAKTAEAVAQALAHTTYQGLAMTYKSDGKGNMAHSEVIVCYDGTSRVPKIVKRYDNLDGAL
ncbi:MAG TPA: ABC transporter substrate-binding protein [Candidatus Sulfotelmatobacter sp.]|nr:ABC transporter substrate-binding protein [Candidatus Sulfotelmatobacter sp.]